MRDRITAPAIAIAFGTSEADRIPQRIPMYEIFGWDVRGEGRVLNQIFGWDAWGEGRVLNQIFGWDDRGYR